MKLWHNIKTCWSVTYFWVSFSVFLATLSTYSFVQVDWIVKRDFLITRYNSNSNGNSSTTAMGQPTTKHLEEKIYSQRTQFFDKNNSSVWSYNKKYTTTSNHIKISEPFQIGSQEDFPSIFYNPNTKESTVTLTKTVIVASFGVLGVCTNYNESYHCELYNGKHHSTASFWPMLTLMGGTGCLTLCVSAVMSVLAVALPTSKMRYQVARTIGQIQAVSVVLLFLSLLLFPLGFGSDFVRFYCGPRAGPYDVGDCEIGWAYALVTVCASLSLYCPILVHFTVNVQCKCLPKHL